MNSRSSGKTFYTQSDIALLRTGIEHPEMPERQRMLLPVVVGASLLHDALDRLLKITDVLTMAYDGKLADTRC
jgi:hypothetical protein